MLGVSRVPDCPTVPIPMATGLPLVSSLNLEKANQLLASEGSGRRVRVSTVRRQSLPAPGSPRPRR